MKKIYIFIDLYNTNNDKLQLPGCGTWGHYYRYPVLGYGQRGCTGTVLSYLLSKPGNRTWEPPQFVGRQPPLITADLQSDNLLSGGANQIAFGKNVKNHTDGGMELGGRYTRM